MSVPSVHLNHHTEETAPNKLAILRSLCYITYNIIDDTPQGRVKS